MRAPIAIAVRKSPIAITDCKIAGIIGNESCARATSAARKRAKEEHCCPRYLPMFIDQCARCNAIGGNSHENPNAGRIGIAACRRLGSSDQT
jgi:hypothetical protein